MKKRVFLLLFLLLPLVSSLELNMKHELAPGETLLASMEGNFLSSIKPEQVYFYSDKVSMPLIFDIARVSNKYYLYALLPAQPREYVLLIKNVNYLEEGQEVTRNIVTNFSVFSNLSVDFSVYPGFIISKQNFSLTLESKRAGLNIIAKFQNSSQTINVFAAGKKKISFDKSLPGEYTLELSSNKTSYSIPVALLLSQIQNNTNITEPVSVSEADKFRFSKSEYNFSVNSGKPQTFTISLSNLGTSEIQNVTLSTSSGKIIPSVKNLDLAESESYEITLSITADDTGTFFSSITAESNSISTSSDIIITVFSPGAVIPPFGEMQKDRCSSLNGVICGSREECTGTLLDSLEGKCCIGLCRESQSYAGVIVGVLILLALAIGAFFIYKKSKSKKMKPEEVIKKKESEFESRINPREISGNLSRS